MIVFYKKPRIQLIGLLFNIIIICFASSNNSLCAQQQKAPNDVLFYNQNLLLPVFEKLRILEESKNGKVNIVHIGDSHIQADFMTHTIRKLLQEKFGNAGYGFTFPYSLAKTNANNIVKYSSDSDWTTYRNISPLSDQPIGLSGINIQTTQQKFHINIRTKKPYEFNTIKVIYPSKEAYGLAYLASEKNRTAKDVTENRTKVVSRNKQHIVKRNETITKIATQYKTTAAEIKRANNLKSNKLVVGKKLVIPVKTEITVAKSDETNEPIMYESSRLFTIEKSPYMVSFSNDKPLEETFIVPTISKNIHNLSGIILEKDTIGLLYHSIGVNGAKITDFNKYKLFFDQLKCLSPDLVIVSLGTNESFNKMSNITFVKEVFKFITNLKEQNPNTIILFMTPAPSLFNRKKVNNYIEEYSKELTDMNACAVWDLLDKVGGNKAPLNTNFSQYMGKDKVHFTKAGYEMMGNLFVSDFLDAYNLYKDTYNILNEY